MQWFTMDIPGISIVNYCMSLPLTLSMISFAIKSVSMSWFSFETAKAVHGESQEWLVLDGAVRKTYLAQKVPRETATASLGSLVKMKAGDTCNTKVPHSKGDHHLLESQGLKRGKGMSNGNLATHRSGARCQSKKSDGVRRGLPAKALALRCLSSMVSLGFP